MEGLRFYSAFADLDPGLLIVCELRSPLKSIQLFIFCAVFTDHFSGPGRLIGRICVSVCVPGLLTFELNDL